MTYWIKKQLGDALDPHHQRTVILDPHRLLDSETLRVHRGERKLTFVTSWIQLRRHWDLVVRQGTPNDYFTTIVQSVDLATISVLPWDIAEEAQVIGEARWPVPLPLRALFVAATDEVASHLAEEADRSSASKQVLERVFGWDLTSEAGQLAAVVTAQIERPAPAEIWDVLATVLTEPTSQSIAAGGGKFEPLQVAWQEWLELGDAAPVAALLKRSAPTLVQALDAGLLKPAFHSARGLPNWVKLGALDTPPDEVVNELLANKPTDQRSFADWTNTAVWWGRVRQALARGSRQTDTGRAAWAVWGPLDAAFRQWLVRSYGSLLLSSAHPPATVHKIAPFLESRLKQGHKILLIVIDGMGFAQWHQLHQAASWRVVEAGGTAAMIPTLTEVSRQAIFAGVLPREFSTSIRTTSQEPRLWESFWMRQGVPSSDVAYHRIQGRGPEELPKLAAPITALVITAIDQILHGSSVMGDRQVAHSVDLWRRTAVLQTLIEQAADAEYEIWITADHGNLPAFPYESGTPREGLRVESAGTRVRVYGNETLRDAASVQGEAWQPPGLPDGFFPLFAFGAQGYHRANERVTHGGISMDEVIVPLARVAQ